MVAPQRASDELLLREWLHFMKLQGVDRFMLFSHAPAGANAPSHQTLLHTVAAFRADVGDAVKVDVQLWPPSVAATHEDERFVDAADRTAFITLLQVRGDSIASLEPPPPPSNTHQQLWHALYVYPVTVHLHATRESNSV
jgi:hypothetical protein